MKGGLISDLILFKSPDTLGFECEYSINKYAITTIYDTGEIKKPYNEEFTLNDLKFSGDIYTGTPTMLTDNFLSLEFKKMYRIGDSSIENLFIQFKLEVLEFTNYLDTSPNNDLLHSILSSKIPIPSNTKIISMDLNNRLLIFAVNSHKKSPPIFQLSFGYHPTQNLDILSNVLHIYNGIMTNNNTNYYFIE
jgi:hypothetical protein